MSKRDDLVLLRHMLDAATEAVSFASGRSRDDLDTDRMLFHSIVRNLGIIGGAASQVSREFRARESGLPWADAIGMRNRVIHAYYDIDHDIVWHTTTQDFPALISELRNLLGEPGQ